MNLDWYVLGTMLGSILAAQWSAPGRVRLQGEQDASPSGVGCVNRPAEICNLEIPIDSQQQILGLDVSVDDVFGVAVD